MENTVRPSPDSVEVLHVSVVTVPPPELQERDPTKHAQVHDAH